MTPKGIPRKDKEETVKTSVDLPRALWRAAKLRAMDENVDLRSVIVKALEMYLKARRKIGGT